jgi:hypothetical protein
MPHELLGIGKLRVAPLASAGPPNEPFGFRVSAILHGVTGTKL